MDGVEWRALDVRDRAVVRALVAQVRPRAVVNTAYVYGDRAVTADGAGHVALAAAEVGARLVHLSRRRPRWTSRPDDEPPIPVFPYGAAKAVAETAVRLVHPAAAVVRTSLIVGDERSKHLNVARPEAVSRVELGALVARRYGFDPDQVPAGTIEGSGLSRPAEVRLDSSRPAGLLKTRLRGVRELLAG